MTGSSFLVRACDIYGNAGYAGGGIRAAVSIFLFLLLVGKQKFAIEHRGSIATISRRE